MLYSITEAIGTGSSMTLPVPPYLDKSHITVYVGGVPTTTYSWITDQSISLVASSGTPVRVVRRTSPGQRLTEYLDGTSLPGDTLEVDSKQAFYLAQEALDQASLGGTSGGTSTPPVGGLTPEYVAGLLTGQITPSQLELSLRSQITLITGPDTLIGSTAWYSAREAQARTLALQAESAARISALQAEAAQRASDIRDSAGTLRGEYTAIATDLAGLRTTVSSEISTRSSETSSLASQITAVQATLQAGQSDLRALVLDVAESSTDLTRALARRAELIRADFESANADITASVLTEAQARSTADSALATQITALDAAYKEADTVLQSNITSEATVRANEDASLASQITALQSTVDAGNRAVTSMVFDLAETVASRDAASARRLQSVQADLQSADSDLAASVTQETQARVSGDTAIASQITALDAAYKAADSTLQAGITSEATTRANGDSALASQITTLDAAYKAADTTLQTSIASEATARADGDTALSTQITALQSTVNTATSSLQALVFDVAESAASRIDAVARKADGLRADMELGNDTLNAAVASEAQARVSADGALAQQITNLTASVNNGAGATTDIQATVVAMQEARADDLKSLAQSVRQFRADFESGDLTLVSAINDVQTVAANANATTAAAVTTVQSQVTALTPRVASVETSASTSATRLGVVESNYTIKVQARSDGKLVAAGIGVTATAGTNTPAQSEMVFLADKFTFVPSQADINAVPQPLLVAGLVNGVNTLVVPPSRYGDKLIEARMIVDGGIEARHMKITGGAGTSVWDDRNFEDPTAWTQCSWGVFPTQGSVTDGAAGGTTLRSPTGGSASAYGTRRVPVTVGRRYRVSCRARRTSTSNGTLFLRLNAASTATGAYSQAVIGVESAIPATTWTFYSAEWVATTPFASPMVLVNHTGTAGYMEAQDIRIEEMLDYSLVVQGGLTADRIDTRGLSIKDASGNVILAAGTPLQAQYVTPDAGWLNSNLAPSISAAANTATWSGISGAGKPADGATAGSNLIKKATFTDGSMGGWGGSAVCAGCHGGAGEIQTNRRDTLENGNQFVVTPGETLYAAGDIWTGGSAYGAAVGAAFLGADGNFISWLGASKGPSQDWSRVSTSILVPAGAVTAVPWLQIDGPGGQDLPYVSFSRLYLGRHQEGATVGAAFGVNISGQITPSNVSTYIANAAIGNAQFGGDLWSTNYSAGSAGWLLRRDGYFECSNIYARGNIQATSLNGQIVGTGNLSGACVNEVVAGVNPSDVISSANTWVTVVSLTAPNPQGGTLVAHFNGLVQLPYQSSQGWGSSAGVRIVVDGVERQALYFDSSITPGSGVSLAAVVGGYNTGPTVAVQIMRTNALGPNPFIKAGGVLAVTVHKR